MAKWVLLLPLVLLFLTAPSHAQQSPPEIVVSYPEGNSLVEFIREDLGAAYEKLGLHMVLKPLPAARSLEAANAGETDAEAGRVAGIAEVYPNLRQVPEPVLELDLQAISIGTALPGSGWNSLKGHHLCTILGEKLVESRTRGFDRDIVRTGESALRMLKAGRCDVMVIYQYQWIDIDRLHLGPVCPGEVLERVPLYHYINKRHDDLVPRLAEALHALRIEGLTARTLAPIQRRIDEAKARNSCASPHSVKDAAHR